MSELAVYASVNPSYIAIYTAFPDYNQRKRNCSTFTEETQKTQAATNSLLSDSAKKNLRLAISTLIFTAKYKLVFEKEKNKKFWFKCNFVTLTLPCKTTLSDYQLASKVLSEFLRKWKKRNPNLLYVWKAEIQDNGNAHYHLTTNSFIHYEKLRIYWNKELKKNGIYNPKLGIMANSTDVHSVKNIRNLAAYLCSYMGKKDVYNKLGKRYHRRFDKKLRNSQALLAVLPKNYFKILKRKYTSKLWGCSTALLNSKVNFILEDEKKKTEINKLTLKCKNKIEKDYVLILPLQPDELKALKETYSLWLAHFNQKLKTENISNQPIEILK